MLKINVDVKPAFAKLNRFEKTVRRATAYALNDVAFAGRAAVQRELDRKFTARPWIRRGVLAELARPDRPIAAVYVRDAQFRYLRENVLGGDRGLKAFEDALRSARLLPAGWYAVPGPALPLDAYGSPRRAALVKILNAIAKRPVVTRGRRASQAARFFAITPDAAGRARLRPGIYERTGTTVRAVLIFTQNRPSYRARLNLHRVVNDAVQAAWPAAVERQLRRIRGDFTR